MHRIIYSLLILLLLLISIPGQAKTINIGYFEPGQYYSHKVLLSQVKNYLDLLKDDTLELIFEPYAYRSAEWDRDVCKASAGDYLRMDDVDMVIAAGPWVVQDLLDAGFKKPIIGIYQFYPEITGLVDSAGNVTASNVTVNYRPGKLASDIEVMLDLFPSRKIGVLYFSTDNNYDEFIKHFENLIPAENFLRSSNQSDPDGLFTFFKSFNDLRGKVDVLYVSPLWGMELDYISNFFLETNRARIPTFTPEGYTLVEKGATASNSVYPHRPLARFTAHKILKIIKGAIPGDLPAKFHEVPGLSLNVKEATEIGVDFDRNLVTNAMIVPAPPSDDIPRYSYELALDQAMRENVRIHLAEQSYRTIVSRTKSAWNSYLPKLNLRGIAGYSDNKPEAAFYNSDVKRKFAAELELEQKLFSYSALKDFDIAENKRQIAKLDKNKTELDISHMVTRAYIEVLRSRELVEAAGERVNRIRTYLDIASVNNQLGITDTIDLIFLEEKMVSAKIDLHHATYTLKAAQIALNVLLNRPGDEDIVLENTQFATDNMVLKTRLFQGYTSTSEGYSELKDYFVQAGIEGGFELRQSDLKMQIQENKLIKNKRFYFPDISLRAKYTAEEEFAPEIDPDNDYWTIGAVLTLPLFSASDWFYNPERVQSEIDELVYRKDSLRFARYEDISLRFDQFINIADILPLKYFVRNSGETSAQMAFNSFLKGNISGVDLINYEKSAQLLNKELIDRRYQFFTKYSELLQSIGSKYLIQGSSDEQVFYRNLEQFIE